MDDMVERVMHALSCLRGIGDIPAAISRLSRGETSVLCALSGHNTAGVDINTDPRLTGTQLSRFIGVSPAAVSQIIKSLENKGYVRRVQDSKDRRIVRVELTETGKTLNGRIESQYMDMIAGLLTELGSEDANTFVALLERVAILAQDTLQEAKRLKKEDRDTGRGEEDVCASI